MAAVSVALASTALFGLLMLVLLGSLLRSGVPGVLEWFAANAVLTAALPLLLARGHISDVVSVVLANFLVTLAGSMLYAGFARFFGRPVRWPWLLLVTFATVPALAYWRYAVDSIPARVVVSTFFTSAICFAIAVIVARNRAADRARYPYVAAVSLATLFGLCQLARGLYFSALPGVSSPLMFTTNVNVILLCVGAAIMPVMSMCAMLMVHDALLADARKAVNHDFLTGALSRTGFQSMARKRFAEADQLGAPLSLLIIDLDRFKAINDTFGHAAGDSVLREFAALTRVHLRRDDALARLGGEEFAVLLPRTSLADARRVAERLRSEASRHAVATDAGPCRYSISGGLAMRERGETLDRLTTRADRALYAAKLAGRDRVCLHETPMEQPVAFGPPTRAT
jgi:diguanylate cyclase (GGDEF)-like protein